MTVVSYGSPDPFRRPDGATPGIKDVIAGDYCVGCGACASLQASPITMHLNERALYVPRLPHGDVDYTLEAKIRKVCPFLDEGPHETALSSIYQSSDATYDEKLGWYRGLYAGHAQADRYRERGSSGGITTWLLCELLDRGLIDAVIHVRPNREDDESVRFRYGISTDRDRVMERAKTRYYPIEMSAAIKRLREQPGRYAFVGVPCFVKAAKRLAAVDPVVHERLAFTLSIFCGHLKSGRFGESLAWQMGVSADQIDSVDFRHKLMDRPASQYGFAVQSKTGELKIAPMRTLAGHDWGMGMFRLKACDYCDDIVGETADIGFGDAWLPAYAKESAGTNLVVVRHPLLADLIADGVKTGALHLNAISAADVIKSQDANYRHRRHGLAYRLWLDDRARRWRPLKRTAARGGGLSIFQKLIFRYRGYMSRSSHIVYAKALRKRDLSIYTGFVKRAAKINWLLTKAARKYSSLFK